MKLSAALFQTGLGTSAVFVRRRRSDGAFWNTSGTPAYEAYNAANIANYAIPSTEVGATGIYEATDPSEAYYGDFYAIVRSGVSLAVSDLVSNIRYIGNSGILDAIPTTIRLKKNTAFSGFSFPMLLTNGVPATGITVAGQVAKDGAAFGNLTNAVTEISAGGYTINLAAADLNANDALLKFTGTGCKTLYIKIVLQA